MVFDFTNLIAEFNAVSNPVQAMRFILTHGGLILFFPLLPWMAWTGWKDWMMNLWSEQREYALLAIDVPKVNEQSMTAVQAILTALHARYFGFNKKEKYWYGMSTDRFSLEIVSIDGYIQYFIRCDRGNMDLVKGAVFAQYPDAEIIEVEDYVDNVEHDYPSETTEMWGTEMTLAKPDVYPLRTFEHFEDRLTGTFADPMAALLELLSRLRPGEQMWLQFVITPKGGEFREKALKEIDDLVGRQTPTKRGFLDKVADLPLNAMESMVHDTIFGGELAPGDDGGDDGSNGNFMNMTTGEKLIVEEITNKASRLHFHTKFRICYFAPKAEFRGGPIGSVMGALRQFAMLHLNSFGGDGKTMTNIPTYLFAQRRQNARKKNIVRAYKSRSNWVGYRGFMLSDNELATIFHFPLDSVRAPLVSKTESKKVQPPSRLPTQAVGDARVAVGHELVEAGVTASVVMPDLPPNADGEPAGEAPAVWISTGKGKSKESAPKWTATPPSAAGVPSASTTAPPPARPVPGQGVASTGSRKAPAPAVVSRSIESSAELSQSGRPIHSMAGLPPGVTPVAGAGFAQAAPTSVPAPAAKPAAAPNDSSSLGAPPPNLPI